MLKLVLSKPGVLACACTDLKADRFNRWAEWRHPQHLIQLPVVKDKRVNTAMLEVPGQVSDAHVTCLEVILYHTRIFSLNHSFLGKKKNSLI